VPVYREKRNNIVAILKMKELVPIVADKKNVGKKVKDLIQPDENILTIYEDTNLMELLMLFEAKKARIALVANKKRKVQAGLNSIYYSVGYNSNLEI
jgi:Mg2+/Co2+ transporter CorB